MPYFRRSKARRIVTPYFYMSRSMRGSTVMLPIDNRFHRSSFFFEIRAYRGNEHNKFVFRCRFYTDLRTQPDQQRTNIKGCPAIERRNIFFIQLNRFNHRFTEHLYGRFRHFQILRRTQQSFGILFHSENTYLSVFTAKRLQPLESLLPIMQACRSYIHCNRIFRMNFQFTPFPADISATDIIRRFHISKS